jgi:outer membrane protein assembly factor BamB
LPPGYLEGFGVSLDDEYHVVISSGTTNVAGRQVTITEERTLSGNDFISAMLGPDYFYIYLTTLGDFKVDRITPEYSTQYFYYGHPLFDWRAMGKLWVDSLNIIKWATEDVLSGATAELFVDGTLVAEAVKLDEVDWSTSYDSAEPYIYSLAVYDGKLYAGGGGNGKVFVFDGTTWTEIYDSSTTAIYSLTVYNGKLYASFGGSGKIYVFDGTTWTESYDSTETDIKCLAVYNGNLYAGSGGGGKVFAYDGTTWTESYDSAELIIFSLATYNGKLYAGSGGNGKIFVFDGATWSESYDSTEGSVYALAVYNGKLYAGSYSSGKIYVFDGTTWTESYDSTEGSVYALAVYNGKLYAGSGVNGKIYVFDGTTWTESYDSTETSIRSLAVYNGKLYAGSYPSGKIFVYGDDYDIVQHDKIDPLPIQNQISWFTEFQGIIDDNLIHLGSDKDYSIGYNSADDSLRIADGADLTTTPRITLLPSGNLGVGVTDPTELVEIENAQTSTCLQISNAAVDGDPYLAFALSGTKKFSIGVDDGDGDKLKIGTTAIGTSTFLTISTTDVVFNEDSADIDFRVESNGNANMLFVDAGNDRIGMGTASPDKKLSFANNYFGIIQSSISNFYITSNAYESAGTFYTSTTGYDADASMIGMYGDYIRLSTYAGAAAGEVITWVDKLVIAASEIVINESGADLDFRVESDTSENALFVQGSDGNVGIGTSTVDEKLHVEGSDGTTYIKVEDTSADSDAGIILDNDAKTWTLEVDGDNGDRFHILENGAYPFIIEASAPTGALFIQTATGDVGIGTIAPNEILTVEGVVSIHEQAGAPAGTAAYGKLWIKNTTPSQLWYTADDGTSTQIV